jgi:cobalt/nickel transport system permease protein
LFIVHISDGILSLPTSIGGYAIAVGISALSVRKMRMDEVPKVSVVTAVFFAASLIHIPIGPTSVHLILNGLAGVILGWSAFVSIFFGLALQSILLQHGGITAIGVNACVMGLPAFAAYGIFRARLLTRVKYREAAFGAIAGAAAVLLAAMLLALVLITTGEEFLPIAKLAALAHIPVIVVEGIIVGFCTAFLARVKPEILERHK